MAFGCIQTVPPVGEPCDIFTLNQMMRVNVTNENNLMTLYLTSARQTFENLSQTQVMQATWKMTLDFWPGWENIWAYAQQRQYDPNYFIYQLLYRQYGVIYIPRPPLISITSVSYYDGSNVLQVWDTSNYTVDLSRIPGRIYTTGTFPTSSITHKPAIEITFVAGYPNLAAVPALIKQGIYLLAGTWYEQRTSLTTAKLNELPFGFLNIVDQYKSFILSDMGMR